jgi:hypothetical protein
MPDELFPVEESLSPKLRWLREHKLATFKNAAGKWGVAPIFTATTEDDAIIDYAQEHGLAHYSVAPPAASPTTAEDMEFG